MQWRKYKDELLLLGLVSLLPILPDPTHPEKYGGVYRSVCFWEWAYLELWEIYTGVELHAST